MAFENGHLIQTEICNIPIIIEEIKVKLESLDWEVNSLYLRLDFKHLSIATLNNIFKAHILSNS